MIKRAVMLILSLSLVAIIIAFNQAASPKPTVGNFRKVQTNGTGMDDWQGPWACVYDANTKLLWEVKTDSETIHDGYWSYSWFNGKVGAPNLGDCYFEKDRCDTLDLIRRTNQEKLCGVAGWRLPTKAELLSLIEKDVKPGAPQIAKAFFPQTKRGDYWASEFGQPLQGTFQYLKEGAVAINFIDGKAYTLPYRNAAFLRLVSDRYRPTTERH